jgi:hypothetical protein
MDRNKGDENGLLIFDDDSPFISAMLDFIDERFERKILSEADNYYPGKDADIINVIKNISKMDNDLKSNFYVREIETDLYLHFDVGSEIGSLHLCKGIKKAAILSEVVADKCCKEYGICFGNKLEKIRCDIAIELETKF